MPGPGPSAPLDPVRCPPPLGPEGPKAQDQQPEVLMHSSQFQRPSNRNCTAPISGIPISLHKALSPPALISGSTAPGPEVCIAKCKVRQAKPLFQVIIDATNELKLCNSFPKDDLHPLAQWALEIAEGMELSQAKELRIFTDASLHKEDPSAAGT